LLTPQPPKAPIKSPYETYKNSQDHLHCLLQGHCPRDGEPQAFLAALGLVILWAATGPIFHFSNTWQLVINTGTTIITFLMVFLIQATQNRDSEAVHLKLDELIRAIHGAHNALLDLEELDEEALDRFRVKYEALAEQARRDMAAGGDDFGTPEVGK